jgi:uncharacterized protein YjdB
VAQENIMINRFRLLARLTVLVALVVGCADGLGPADPADPSRVARVTVAPADLALEVGSTVALAATPLDAAGSELRGLPIGWTSTDSAVATVSPAGVVTARAPGTAAIHATTGGVSGSMKVTVAEKRVAWIQITPAGGVISQAIGTSRQLGVIARAMDGTEILGSTVTWASSVPSVASVSAGGLLHAHAAGTSWVKAEVDGRRDSTLVSVPTLIARIETDVSELSLSVGDARGIAATAVDATGNPLARIFRWSTANVAVATVDSVGRVEARGAGTTEITVTSEGKSATVLVTVVGQQWQLATVGGAPLPADLFTTTVTVSGETRPARFQATGGTFRVVRGAYDIRLWGWLLVDGEAPVAATRSNEGALAYDVFTGELLLFEGDQWHDRQPRFRGRSREDGGLELDWNPEPGAATVALRFAP